MISSIGLKNIRVFKDWIEFDLSPITILTGTNDSGKSALQKALNLLSNGFERIQGGMCNFEKIQFSKEFLELTGDFAGNLSYGSKNQNLEVSFNFEDELFGPVKAEISYEKGIDNLTAIAQKMVFKQNGIEFLCFNRYNNRDYLRNKSKRKSAVPINEDTLEKVTEFMDDEEYIWKLSTDNMKFFQPFLRNLILREREEGRFLKKLQYIQDKFNQNEKLNDEEKKLWKRMKKLKIDFYKARRIGYSVSDKIPDDIKEKRDKDRLFRLWRFQGKWSEIFDKFYSPFNEILFDNQLVELVLGEEEILTGTKNPKLLPIYNTLVNNGISNKDDFLNAYIKFEIELINSFIAPYINGYEISDSCFHDYFLWDQDWSWYLTKKEILNEKLIKSSIIAQILNDNDLYPWYETDEEPSKKFEDQILFVRESLFGLTKSLGKELNKLSDSIQFSTQNSTIKRHLFMSDKTIYDSPLLEFGLNFINDVQPIKKSIDFINTWIKEFEIADEFSVKPITIDEEKIGVSYYLNKGGKMHSLGDSGRGINQLFFILLKVATLAKNSILILEEPETNMHPALQSKLADMIIMAKNKFNVSFIIETHSEYLIRRLQFLVARSQIINQPDILQNQTKKIEKIKVLKFKELEGLKDCDLAISHNDVSIYYLYNPGKIPHGEVQVRKLEIRADGILKQDFGKGFFDETVRSIRNLLTLQNAN